MAQSVTLRAATTEWLPTFVGEIRLECGPANVDLRRLRAGQLRLCVDHDITAPIGHVVRLTPTGEAVTGQAELVEVENTRAALADVNSGLKAGLSFGFVILAARLLKEGDDDYRRDVMRMVISRWQAFELSCTAAPLGIRSRIVGGLTGPPEREAASVSVDAKTAARPKTAPTKRRPRRSLDAGLKRETSPAPPRLPRRAVTESDYVSQLIDKRQSDMTTALTAMMGAAGVAHQAAGASAPPADSPDADSPLAKLISVACSPATPQVHHQAGGLELHMDAGRGWAKLPLAVALQPAPALRSAFDTTNTPGAIGEQAAGEIRQVVEDEAVAAVLAGVTSISGLTGDALPSELTDGAALSSWVAENAAAAYPDAALTDLGAALKPRVARASTSYSLQLAVMAGARFEASIERHLRRALRLRVVQGVVTGSGINYQPLGVNDTPGVAAVEYQAADTGKLDGFFDAEDALDGAPTINRFWLVATDLYRRARRVQANVAAGGDRRVIDAQLAGPRVGGESLAYATDLLDDGHAIYGEWSDAALFSWADALLTIDKITHPGLVRVTLQAYINCDVRPGSFAILRPA